MVVYLQYDITTTGRFPRNIRERNNEYSKHLQRFEIYDKGN